MGIVAKCGISQKSQSVFTVGTQPRVPPLVRLLFPAGPALIPLTLAVDAQSAIAVEDLGQPVVRHTLGMRCVTLEAGR